MTTKEQIEILQAYERGEKIEWKRKNSDVAFIVLNDKNHEFNFEYSEYRIKGKRWRAEKDKEYFCIDGFGEIFSSIEQDSNADNWRYDFANYFRTQEDAEKARELLKECLTKFHEEND